MEDDLIVDCSCGYFFKNTQMVLNERNYGGTSAPVKPFIADDLKTYLCPGCRKVLNIIQEGIIT